MNLAWLSELHSNVAQDQVITFLDHYRSPILDGKYTIKRCHILEAGTIS